MSNEKDYTHLQNVLDQLGDTEKKVAESLRSLGIRGMPRMPSCCPITKYVRSKGFRGVRTTRQMIYWCSHSMLRLPEPIQDFIKKFDNNEFEFLQER